MKKKSKLNSKRNLNQVILIIQRLRPKDFIMEPHGS